MTLPPDILQQQMAYYRARATEYDEWFLRTGRYDRGDEWNSQWFQEVAELQNTLADFGATGDVLELACGTGWWTEQLAKTATTLTAVDASAEVIAINRQKLGTHPVTYIQTDLFAWEPQQQYDVVFFSFWLSHVPPERFVEFWGLIDCALKPGGRVFLIDSYQPRSAASEPDTILNQRLLNNGSEFTIIKIFYQPEELQVQLRELGWDMNVSRTTQHFIYGSGQRLPQNR
jgi:2-polyprenyl-3-methyl-5-hydroxy-6-metoxy-1,4-benzoquinol methylase